MSTRSLHNVDHAAVRRGDHDNQLDAVADSINARINHIKMAMATDGRTTPHASEQRELEAIRDTAKIVGARDNAIKAVQQEDMERRWAEHEKREAASAELYMRNPGIFGGPSRASNTVGSNLADAIDNVRSGRVATAMVDLEVHNGLTEGGDFGQGVPTQFGDVQRTLRARSVVMGLPGLRQVEMSSDRLRYPRIGEATAVAVAEEEQFTEDTPDLDTVTLQAAKFVVYTEMSDELQQDFNADAMDVIGSNMLDGLARKVDYELLEGDGSSGIVGIRNWPGINTTSVAGVPANFAKFAEVEYELDAANADMDLATWLMHQRTWFELSKVKTGISSDETTLLQPDPQMGAKSLLGYGVRKSSQITLTEGAGAGSWAGLVDASQMVVGIRHPAQVEVSRDFKFDQDIIALRAKTRIGFAVINAGAVSIATDVRAS